MYGTINVKRDTVKPGALVRHNGKTWTASANTAKALYLRSAFEQTCTKTDDVEVIITEVSHAV